MKPNRKNNMLLCFTALWQVVKVSVWLHANQAKVQSQLKSFPHDGKQRVIVSFYQNVAAHCFNNNSASHCCAEAGEGDVCIRPSAHLLSSSTPILLLHVTFPSHAPCLLLSLWCVSVPLLPRHSQAWTMYNDLACVDTFFGDNSGFMENLLKRWTYPHEKCVDVPTEVNIKQRWHTHTHTKWKHAKVRKHSVTLREGNHQ